MRENSKTNSAGIYTITYKPLTTKLDFQWRWLLSVLRWWFCCCWFVVDCYSHCGNLQLFYVLLCVLFVHSSFAIISMGKRELVALLCLCSLCLMIVVWLFLAMPRDSLHFVIVIFPDHTHLLFCTNLMLGQSPFTQMIRYSNYFIVIFMNIIETIRKCEKKYGGLPTKILIFKQLTALEYWAWQLINAKSYGCKVRYIAPPPLHLSS